MSTKNINIFSWKTNNSLIKMLINFVQYTLYLLHSCWCVNLTRSLCCNQSERPKIRAPSFSLNISLFLQVSKKLSYFVIGNKSHSYLTQGMGHGICALCFSLIKNKCKILLCRTISFFSRHHLSTWVYFNNSRMQNSFRKILFGT